MNKLQARNKICFQNNTNFHINLKLSKLKKKKWNLFKKKLKFKKIFKPEKKKNFYQKRLFEKQQLRVFYGGIKNYQLKNLFKKLKDKKKINNIFNELILLLEQRLDINLVRLKFVKTIFQAKQLINHNKIMVNQKKINKANFLLKKGDIITLIEKKKLCYNKKN